MINKIFPEQNFDPNYMNTLSHPRQFLTKNKKLLETKEYNIVMDAIAHLWDSGIIQRGSGYCYSISDMVYKILLANDIKCRLMECSLTIATKNPPSLNIIGEEHIFSPSETRNSNIMNTHVVCITNTPVKMIIDLSINDVFDLTGVMFVCEELVEDENSSISGIYKINYPNSTWIYHEKRQSKIPQIHQDSIIKRYETDKKIFDKFQYFNKVIIITLCITSLNMIRGMYDFYQNYSNQYYRSPLHKSK